MTNAAVILAAKRQNAYMEVSQVEGTVFIDITAPFGRYWDKVGDNMVRASYTYSEGRYEVGGYNVGSWSAMWEKLENVVTAGHSYPGDL